MDVNRAVTLALVGLLAALHQDAWLWDDASLWLGFLPAGLGYHAAFSVTAVAVWALVVRFAWPTDPFADEDAP